MKLFSSNDSFLHLSLMSAGSMLYNWLFQMIDFDEDTLEIFHIFSIS